MTEATDKPTQWEGSGDRWFRRAAVYPNVLCHVTRGRDGVIGWHVMFGLPGVCADDEMGDAETPDMAKRAADAAALRMINGVRMRMAEAIAAMPVDGESR